jgi:hypothetical protein
MERVARIASPGRFRPTITGTSRRASVKDTRVWQLAFLPSAPAYCGANPHRAASLLGQRRVIDNRPGIIVTPDLSVGFGPQGDSQRCRIPDAAGDKVMKLIIADRQFLTVGAGVDFARKVAA